MALDFEAVRAGVEASCERQGVPVAVADPAIVAEIGRLVTGGRSHDELSAYPEAFEQSWLKQELDQ